MGLQMFDNHKSATKMPATLRSVPLALPDDDVYYSSWRETNSCGAHATLRPVPLITPLALPDDGANSKLARDSTLWCSWPLPPTSDSEGKVCNKGSREEVKRA